MRHVDTVIRRHVFSSDFSLQPHVRTPISAGENVAREFSDSPSVHLYGVACLRLVLVQTTVEWVGTLVRQAGVPKTYSILRTVLWLIRCSAHRTSGLACFPLSLIRTPVDVRHSTSLCGDGPAAIKCGTYTYVL
jgi:hypothetical protein